ncbi:MAG: hypothetical protein AAF515_07160 [Pseudomonadota bacterium]
MLMISDDSFARAVAARLIYLAALLTCFAAQAATEAAAPDAAEPPSEAVLDKDNSLFASRVAGRLLPFEPTYLVYQDTDGDERSVEARLSFKYALTPPECSRYSSLFEEKVKCHRGYEAFIAFNGTFDFYLGTRPSDPFLPRFLNPSIHLNKYFDDINNGAISLRYWGIAIQHLSNGQTIDPEEFVDEQGRTLAELYEINPGDDRFDQVGHGLNFVSVQAGLRLGKPESVDPDTGRCVRGCWDLYAQYNPYIWSDGDNLISWGPNEGIDEVADFYRYRLKLDKTVRVPFIDVAEHMVFSATATAGDAGVDDGSIDLSITYPFKVFGLLLQPYVAYHAGSLANLADYAQPRDAWSFGLKFGGM